ncbi:MAG: hypothetical protein NUW00_03580 [Candidatus Kaiserbacteria bacterium]|nr:hypothetical protein [Candidatus Kaiserbacteria bacterium]MCR4330421.1 hypothetical protein [Patescibacteria group bacterium]
MDKDTSLEITLAVNKINDVLWADSRVRVKESQLLTALSTDVRLNGGCVPTDEEIDALVMGDDDGDIPPDLKRQFPRTNQVLAAQF